MLHTNHITPHPLLIPNMVQLAAQRVNKTGAQAPSLFYRIWNEVFSSVI